MKILILSHEYPPVGNGGASACRCLAECFVRDGYTVHVVTCGYEAQYGKESLYEGRLVLFRVPAKREHRGYSSGIEMLDYLYRGLRLSGKLVREEKYSLCLAFFGMPGGIIAWQLNRRFRLPYIIRFGGGDIPGFQTRFRFLYPLTAPFLRRVWQHADALVANSSGLKKLARSFCDKYPIRVIPNGVDAVCFNPGEHREKHPDRIELLTVSRLVEWKGIQDVIPYLRPIEQHLHEKGIFRELRYTIVGDGPYCGQLMKLADKYTAKGQIRFEGRKNREELIALFQQADLFVFPSRREGMPNAVLEAMASGLPILMRESCQGAEELVRENGMLAEEAFEKTLEELVAAGPDIWQKMGEKSREMAQTRFSWESTAAAYERLFQKACGDDKAR